jgi:DNA-directed RNA polymerase specialized sigma24 family protein
MLIGGINVVVDCGVSADDLVSETIEELFQSANGLGWRESKGTLPVFLGAILKNKFIDHMRRDVKVVRPDPDAHESTGPRPTTQNPDNDIAHLELQDGLLRLIKGEVDEKELEELILAGSMITGGGKVNQQLAEILGVEVGEVINRRKRLWRVAGVRELHEEFRHARKAIKSIHQGNRAADGEST